MSSFVAQQTPALSQNSGASRPPAANAGPDPASPTSKRGKSASNVANIPMLSPLPNSSSVVVDWVATIARDLNGAQSSRLLLCAALRAAARLAPTQHVSIFLTGEDDGSMIRAAQPHDELGRAMAHQLDVMRVESVRTGIVGRVLATNQAACVQDTAADPDFDASVDCAPGYVVRSCLCAPVVGSHGRVLAAVQLINREADGATHGRPRQPMATPTAADHALRFTDADANALAMFTAMLGAPLQRQLILEGFES